jgi:hypothetical protein
MESGPGVDRAATQPRLGILTKRRRPAGSPAQSVAAWLMFSTFTCG